MVRVIPWLILSVACNKGGSENTAEARIEQLGRSVLDYFTAEDDKEEGEIAARHAEVEWVYQGAVVGSGVSDDSGNYQISGFFPTKETISSCIQMRSPVPRGNNLWTACVPVEEFQTEGKGTVIDVTPPLIVERVLSNDDLDEPLGASLPLLATHDFRKSPDDDQFDIARVSAALVYDGSKSNNSEAGRATVTGVDVIELPAFTDGGGVVVIDSVEINFDYESFNDASAAPNVALLGLTDLLGGPYGNFKIHVVLTAAALQVFGNDVNFCTTTDLNDLESGFGQAIAGSGGVVDGMLPGFFWSGSDDLAEHFNTSYFDEQGNFHANDLGIGTTSYMNLPLIDFDVIGPSQSLAILVTESDEGFGNDIVACWENVGFSSLTSDPDSQIEMDNASFLSALGVVGDLITEQDIPYTFSIAFAHRDSVETWESHGF